MREKNSKLGCKLETWVFLGVLAVTLWLRIWGINYGLPFAFGNGDEEPVVRNAMSFGALKTLHPIFFNYPALYSYLLFFLYGLYFLLGLTTHVFTSLADFAFAYSVEPGMFHLIGRYATALLGSATVGFVYLFGKKAFGVRTGLLAAWFLSFSSLHVIQSHWALPDVPMVFLSTLALYFMYLIAQRGNARYYVYAGIFAGLAISTKYNAGLLVFPLFVAHISNGRSEGHSLTALIFDKKLFLAYGLTAISFIIGSPYWLLDFSSYYKAFLFESTHMRVGHLGIVITTPWSWVIPSLMNREKILGLAFIFGIIYSLFRHNKVDLILLSFALVSVLYIGSWAKAGLHYMLPIWPILSILTARWLFELGSMVISRERRRNYLLFTSAILIILPSSISIMQNDYRMSNKDTRIVAKEWIEENIPPDSKIAFTWYAYCPPLVSQGSDYMTTGTMRWSDPVFKKKLDEFFGTKKTYRLYELKTKHTNGKKDLQDSDPFLDSLKDQGWKDIRDLRVEGIEYVILSDYVYQRYFTTSPPPAGNALRTVFDRNKKYFESLLNSPDLSLVKEFVPSSHNLGPVLKIYKVNQR